MSEFKQNKINNLGDAVRYHAERTPDKVATVFEDRTTTYAQFDVLTSRVANGLIALGVTPQTRVGYYGKNSDYHAQIQSATAKANAVLVPVNWRLAPPEAQFIIDHADVKVLFVGPEFRALVRKIRDQLPTLETIIALDGPDDDWQDFATWRDAQSDVDPMVPHTREDICFQLYTSGTTGRPKGVMLPNACAFAGFVDGEPPDMSLAAGTWREVFPDDVSLCIAPNFHLSGNGGIYNNISAGQTVVIHPEFDVQKSVAAILDYKISKIFMVPAVLQILLEKAKQGADLSSIKLISYGASPIPPELMREAVEVIGCGFLQMYGMTEIGASCTFLEPEDHSLTPTEQMKSCGKAGEIFEMKIVDPVTKKDLPIGESGEVAIKSPAPMKGYYKQPKETAEVLIDGWYYSGDVGYMDADGYFYIQDRLKDMIVSGGENIYTAEVESALFEHPAVREVAVFGVPSVRWGEEVKAVVAVEEGQSLTEDELVGFARELIAGYKIPKSVDFIDALPRNGTGKVMKHVLRDPYWEGMERQVG